MVLSTAARQNMLAGCKKHAVLVTGKLLFRLTFVQNRL
jgi:type IV secretory pathway TrbD component